MPPVALEFPVFVPRRPWLGGDLQTLRNAFRGPVRRPPEAVRRERIELPLTTGSAGDRLSGRIERPPERRAGAPLVVLIHGLGGDETSVYLGSTAAHLLAQGFRVLRLNLRGAGASRALCREQYHAGRSEDLADALRALPEDLRADGVAAVGFSLGGNMLLKHLSEHTGLRAAVSVSAPIDLAASSRRIHQRRNRLYHRYLLDGMKREALAAPDLTDTERRTLPTIERIFDFDDRIVAPRNGFAGALDYYSKTHARQYLAAIRTPTLVIHAQDDPWIPTECYTNWDWSSNAALRLLFPRSGGHVGFHARDDRTPWHDRCIARFLSTA